VGFLADQKTETEERPAGSTDFEAAAYRTVTWRLMPLLFTCYILAYIDRINVGFAKLQMQRDLGMSDSVYGIGAGIFFIGYFFFEVPANILLQKLGAKYWLGSIMIFWGVTSASTMLVHSARLFYVLRFLLGMVESGFFPGVILYLTFWYPTKRRARMVAVFMTAIPLSGVVGGAVSGWILEHLSTATGLRGWQWLYLVEGLPSVLAGIAAIVLLENGPAQAPWLTEGQRVFLAERLREDEQSKKRAGHNAHRLSDAFCSPGVWLLSAVYFGFVMASYGLGFWLPQIISDTITHDAFQIGLISMIPWGIGAGAMVLVGRHSDRTGERRWHVSISGLVGALAFAVSAIPGISGVFGLTALTVATAGVMGCISTFWALPTGFLSSVAAAAGIAWINSVGNLAGYVSPFLVGRLRDATHSMFWPLLMLSLSCLVAALLIPTLSSVESKESSK
jgi:MFS family permease